MQFYQQFFNFKICRLEFRGEFLLRYDDLYHGGFRRLSRDQIVAETNWFGWQLFQLRVNQWVPESANAAGHELAPGVLHSTIHGLYPLRPNSHRLSHQLPHRALYGAKEGRSHGKLGDKFRLGVPPTGVLWQIFEPKMETQYFPKNCKWGPTWGPKWGPGV